MHGKIFLPLTKKALDLLFTAVDHRHDDYLLNYFFVIVFARSSLFFPSCFFFVVVVSYIRNTEGLHSQQTYGI